MRKLLTISAILVFGNIYSQTAMFFQFNNRWKPDEYIHIENGPVLSGKIEPGWFSAQWIIEDGGDGFMRLKNRFRNTYLHCQFKTLESGNIQPIWWSAQWKVEDAGEGFIRIRNRQTGSYLHNQNGPLELGDIKPGWWSAQWKKMPVNGGSLAYKSTGVSNANPEQYLRFQNRWVSNEHINIEKGPVQSSKIEPGWWSAQWIIEDAAEGFIRLKNRFKNTYLHCQFKTLESGNIQPIWWSAQWKVEDAGEGFIRIRNRQTGSYLHNQNGQLELGEIKPGWWSAQWKKVPAN